jgi:anti-anti-sigma factor
MGEALTIRVRRDRGYVIVAVAGEVDIATVTRLRERLFELAASGRTLVVDLDQVSFIDSAGLAALVGAARRAAAHGASLQVVCARPRTRQLFRLTGLDGPVPLARTLAGALESLAAARPAPACSRGRAGPGRRPGPGGRDAAPAAAGGSVGMCSAARWSPRPGG